MATLIRGLEISQEPRLLSVQREYVRVTETSSTAQAHSTVEDDQKDSAVSTTQIPDADEQIYQSFPLSPLFGDPPAVNDSIAQLKHDVVMQTDQEALEMARAKATEEGHSEGYKQGVEEAKNEFHERLSALQRLIGSASNALDNNIVGSEDAIVAIAFEATCKILGDALLKTGGVKAVVREVINRAKDRERLVIRLSRTDYQMLEQEKLDFLSADESGRVEVIPDDRVILGGCLVETSGGNLDGRLEIQLQLLREILLSAKKSRNEVSI